jgi:MFS family permease
MSFFFLTKYYEPKTGNKIVNRDNFFSYFKNFGNDDFVKFSVFTGLMSFAVYLSVPFFAVYMLRDLGFSYLKYMLITTSASVTLLLTLSSWGKHADKIGNISVIKLSAVMISILPALWIFSSSTIYLIIVQIFAGFAWGGFNLAVVNFIYDKSAKEKRISNFSFFNLINGLGIFAGSIIGGFLIPNLPAISGNKILTLFLISAIVRFIASVMLSNIKDSKNIRTVGSFELFFSIIGIKPIIGVQQDTVRIE